MPAPRGPDRGRAQACLAAARGPRQRACAGIMATTRGPAHIACAGMPGCRESARRRTRAGQSRRRERHVAVVAIAVAVVVVSLSCRSRSRSSGRSHGGGRVVALRGSGSGSRCRCYSQGEEEKKGGLTFCRVVGSTGACCRRCPSPPLLRTVTLAGPSWAGAGATLCARSCSRVWRSSRQWGGEAWATHQIECALSRQTWE